MIVGIFPCPAAVALVQKKLDAVYIRKEFAGFGYAAVVRLSRNLEVFGFLFEIKLSHFGNLPPLNLRRSEAKFFFKSLLQIQNIAVLAKNQRNNQPVISGSKLSIAASIAEKFALLPSRHVGRRPVIFQLLFGVR